MEKKKENKVFVSKPQWLHNSVLFAQQLALIDIFQDFFGSQLFYFC